MLTAKNVISKTHSYKASVFKPNLYSAKSGEDRTDDGEMGVRGVAEG